MPEILIITDRIDVLSQSAALLGEQADAGSIQSSMRSRMVSALKQAIATDDPLSPADSIQVITTAELAGSVAQVADRLQSSTIICPLTRDLPADFVFPRQAIWAACRNIEKVRQIVSGWQIKTSAVEPSAQTDSAVYWLPIVLTAKGPLYAEMIGCSAVIPAIAQPNDPLSTNSPYVQPIHLADAQRQPLYQLGYRLLKTLAAPPSVYLLQFQWVDPTHPVGTHPDIRFAQLAFDRVLPFPDAPAIASLNTQKPDLFDCYWRCLTRQPIRDLCIV